MDAICGSHDPWRRRGDVRARTRGRARRGADERADRALLAGSRGWERRRSSAMIVDLSVVVDATTQGPPAAGSPPVVLETAFRGPGHWQSSRIAALLHTGTHVDAPLHVVAGGRPIQAIGLDELAGTAVVLDLHDASEREAIDAERLSRAAAALSHAPAAGEVVVVRTDWTDRWWGTFPDYYTRSPFLTEDAGA